jgi:hypothetical protein
LFCHAELIEGHFLKQKRMPLPSVLPMAGKKAGKKTRSFEQVFLCVPKLRDYDNIFASLRLNY